MKISLTPEEFYSIVLDMLNKRNVWKDVQGPVVDFAMINTTYGDAIVENITTIDRVDVYFEGDKGRQQFDYKLRDGTIIEQGGFDEAPRGYLTRADESGIEYYIKQDKERYEGRLYVVHPDDLEAVRAYYPKQIPMQMED